MRRMSITYFFTVRLFVPFGTQCSAGLVCLGLCLVRWQICLQVGSWEVGLGVLLFGRWFLSALCSVYGWKGMRDALRIRR